MPVTPPPVSSPPIRTPLVLPQTGLAASPVAIWFNEMFHRVGGSEGRTIVGGVAVFESAVGQAALAAAAPVILLTAPSPEQWKVRGILLSGAGTNFSGGGGDRGLSVSDGAATWTVVPAATLQALAAARWGDTGVPYPAVATHLNQASAAGTNITAQYSGGATDYTAGALTLILFVERVA